MSECQTYFKTEKQQRRDKAFATIHLAELVLEDAEEERQGQKKK